MSFPVRALALAASVPFSLAAARGEEQAAAERLDPAGVGGSLVIAGGGQLPDAVFDRFVRLAGGDKARLVVIPTAGEAADKDDPEKILEPWKARKAASAVVLHTRSREKAD